MKEEIKKKIYTESQMGFEPTTLCDLAEFALTT